MNTSADQTFYTSDNDNQTPCPQRSNRPWFVRWWLNWTCLPDPPAEASFAKRARARTSQLVSIISLAFLLVFLSSFSLALAFSRIPFMLFSTAILLATILAILLNRTGKTLAASLVLVVSAELALSSLLLSIRPFDSINIQAFDFFIPGELLAASLLPASSIFLIAFYHMAFMASSLFFDPQTLSFKHTVPQPLLVPMLAAAGIQILIAGAAFLWGRGAAQAIERAERVEGVITLERHIAHQMMQVAEEKQLLEVQINRIVQSYVDALNNRMVIDLPFSEETRMLWPLINVTHSLQQRLRSAREVERELQRLKKAIVDYTNLVNQQRLSAYEPWPQTRTDLDVLVYAFQRQAHVPSATETTLVPVKLQSQLPPTPDMAPPGQWM
jgi:hypothetical protein